jgi:sn-glycerol 3-phosphate transport system substrate-binding protein
VAQAGGELAGANGRKVLQQCRGVDGAAGSAVDLMRTTIPPTRDFGLGTGPRDFTRGQGGDDLAHHRQPHQHQEQRRGSPFGVSMLPAHTRRGSPTGGGNFHLFKGANAAQRQARLAPPGAG